MKSHKQIYAFLFGIILVFGIFVLYQRIQSRTLFNSFLKEAHLKKQDILYHSFEKPFAQNRLILYGVTLPQLKINHKISKVIIRKQNNHLVLQLQGLQIDVPKSLYAYYGTDFINALKLYKPFEDALNSPLISLGVMNLDTIKGDAVLIFNPTKTPTSVDAHFSFPKLGEIQLSFKINPLLDQGFRRNLIYIGYGLISEINVDIQDTGMFKSYADYLSSLGTEKTDIYAKELMRHSSFARRVNYAEPLSLKPAYK